MNENLINQIVVDLLQDGTIKMDANEIAAAITPAIQSLPKPYLFRGVVQLGIFPGRILTPTLYVAVAGGWYPGFSKHQVNEGDICFFTSDDGGYWQKITAFSSGGGSQVQSDWNQTDDTQPDYIKNKPNISGGGLQIINSTTDWYSVSTYGVTYSTKEEAAAACGISEEMLDAIVAGEIIGPIRFPAMYEGGTDYIVLAYLHGNYFAEGGGEVKWGKEEQPDYIAIEYDPESGYSITGLKDDDINP